MSLVDPLLAAELFRAGALRAELPESGIPSSFNEPTENAGEEEAGSAPADTLRLLDLFYVCDELGYGRPFYR